MTEDQAIKWLFSSPFDRSEGLRQKTIAVHGADTLFDQASQLAKKGYQIIKLQDASEDTVIDVIYTDTTIDREVANKAKFIWTAEGAEIPQTDNIVIHGKELVETTHAFQ